MNTQIDSNSPSLTDMQTEQLDRLSECTDTPDAPERFTDFARRLFAVPKEEYDADLVAVKNGKPLKHGQRRAKPAH